MTSCALALSGLSLRAHALGERWCRNSRFAAASLVFRGEPALARRGGADAVDVDAVIRGCVGDLLSTLGCSVA
jgi:hypothetical protein